KVMNVLRLIHEEKQRRQTKAPNIVVNFVAQADNYRELPELARQLAPLGIYFFGVNPLHHFSVNPGGYDAYYNKYKLSHVDRTEWEGLVAEAKGIAEGAGMIFENFVNPAFEWPTPDTAPTTKLHVHAEPAAEQAPPEASGAIAPSAAAAPVPTNPETGLPSMYCHYPWTTLYLSASGTAKVCCYMGVKEGLGSFTAEGGIANVWNGPQLQSVREHIRDGRVHEACRECVAHRSFENHA